MAKLAAFFNIRRRVSVLACAIATTALGVEFNLLEQNARAQIQVPITPLLSCLQGMETVNYNPGLTNQEKQIAVNVQGYVSGCINIQERPITSGTYGVTVPDKTSCNALGALGSYKITFNWNTGESSIANLPSSNIVRTAGGQTIIESTGTIESGRFQGKPVVRTIIYLTTALTACNTPEGLTTLTGSQTLTILPF